MNSKALMIYPVVNLNSCYIDKSFTFILLDEVYTKFSFDIINEKDLVWTLYGAYEDIPYFIDLTNRKICFDTRNARLYKKYVIIENVKFIKIPEFPKYYISKCGLIYSLNTHSVMKPKLSKFHYYLISLVDKYGYRKTISIHKLVYVSWVNNYIPPGLVIDHIDGKKWNNNFENLEVVTYLENTKRAIINGQITHSKWSEEEIREICEMLVQNFSYFDIYKKYENKCSLTSMKYLCSNLIHHKHSWIQISNQYDFSNYVPKRRYSKITIHLVCSLLEKGKCPKDIAILANVPIEYVYGLKELKVIIIENNKNESKTHIFSLYEV